MKETPLNQVIIMLLCVSISFGCSNIQTSKDVETSSVIDFAMQHKQAEIYPIELKIDTTSQFQNKQIEPEDSLFFGNEKFLTHLIEGDETGYVLFSDSLGFQIALIDWANGYKVIGVTRISVLSQGEEYIELLYSNSPITSITFGIIKPLGSEIKTIKAWRINDSKKLIEEIDPSTVDFTETYNTEI